MPNPITILHVFGGMKRAGAELRTLDLLRHVDRRQFCFHFCTLAGVQGQLDDEIRELGGTVHSLRHGWIGFSGQFRRLLENHRFDVVYSHVLNYSGLILRLAAQSDVPVRAAVFRSVCDGRRSNPIRTLYRKLMRRWIDRHATHLLAVGEGVMDGVWGPDWKADPRCEVIYNGLDLAPFRAAVDERGVRREFGISPNAPFYIHVGHMRPPKNHLRLIDIFDEVVRRQPAAILLLVGQGHNAIEQRLHRRIAQLGIDGQVVFCQGRTDVPRLLGAADALIFPSLWEGLPGVVLEASAAGTPVLASDLPGVRDIAARLPRVRCLSLDADNTQWAKVLQEMTATASSPFVREVTRRAFTQSIFTIDRCAERHCRIWRSSRTEAAETRAA